MLQSVWTEKIWIHKSPKLDLKLVTSLWIQNTKYLNSQMFKSIAVTYNNNPEINDLWVNSSFMCFCTEIWFWCYSIFFHWERWLQKYNDQWQTKERPIQEDQSNLYCQCAHCVEIFRKPCQNNLIGVCYPCVNCKPSNPTSFVKIHPKKGSMEIFLQYFQIYMKILHRGLH